MFFYYNKLTFFRSTNFGGRDQLSMLNVLQKKSVQYKESGMAKITIRENPLIVVILTPIMLRAHKEWFSNEVVFVDSSGSCDQTNTCVTFMFSASKIGAIPLACILHTAQTEANYSLAFSLLKESLPENCFGNAPYPQVFMTDDSAAERNALLSVFSVSENERPILYLCIFHVCQAFWRWLWDSHNNILKENRRYVMKLFQNIMYALTVEEANDYFNEFMKDNIVQKYDNLKTHVSKFWLRKEEWCLCFRKNVMTRGNNTNNFVESSIRIFKDIVLQRCKAFNMCALVDFIVNVFESYHKRHILSFANNRSTKNNFLYMKFCQKIQNMHVQKINEYIYSVSSNTDQSLIYTVDIDLAMCDCPYGSSGKFCKHLCAVQEKCGIVFKNAPLLTSNDKKMLAKLSLGYDVSEDFFENMDANFKECDIKDDNTNKEESHRELSSITITQTEDGEVMDKKHLSAIEELNLNFTRLTEMASENRSVDLTNSIIKLNATLNKIKTPSQLATFFCNIKKTRYSVNIGVQPGSISRRKKRPGLTSGAKRIQSGRPSNQEVAISKKRKRNLGKSIAENMPNAKSHSRN